MYDGGNTSSSGLTSLSGFSASSNMDVYGSSSADSMNLNIDRSSTLTGNLTIALGAGDDSVNSAKLKNADSIDLGAGDDTISMMLSGSYGTPAIGSASLTKLDGGAGNDTIGWGESVSGNGQSLTLTTGGAVNFENMEGSGFNDTLTGDANANILTGTGGLDTLNGGAGNDILFAYNKYSGWADGKCASFESSVTGGTENDLLYGGADDDRLCGSNGDNTLDGGRGKDTITSGSGTDSIVIRSGDGNTDIAKADVLTDFTDGTDLIVLDGLVFGDITRAQGSGDYVNHVVLKYGAEYLLIIENTLVGNVTSPDFN
jgi:Ca2+-binding RTX toxin-like protein